MRSVFVSEVHVCGPQFCVEESRRGTAPDLTAQGVTFATWQRNGQRGVDIMVGVLGPPLFVRGCRLRLAVSCDTAVKKNTTIMCLFSELSLVRLSHVTEDAVYAT